MPFRATKKRKAITRTKIFLFDLGVTNSLARRGQILPKSDMFGRAFEHWVTPELRTYLAYRHLSVPLQYWRSTSGFEVDLVVGRQLALEIKSTEQVSEKHLRGLKALQEEQLVQSYAVVSLDPTQRRVDGIMVYPWRTFVEALWADKIITSEA